MPSCNGQVGAGPKPPPNSSRWLSPRLVSRCKEVNPTPRDPLQERAKCLPPSHMQEKTQHTVRASPQKGSKPMPPFYRHVGSRPTRPPSSRRTPSSRLPSLPRRGTWTSLIFRSRRELNPASLFATREYQYQSLLHLHEGAKPTPRLMQQEKVKPMICSLERG